MKRTLNLPKRSVSPGCVTLGRVGVKQRGEQLDLPAPHAQFAHASAVHRPLLACAARVHLEERAQAADPRRLDVDDARRQRRRADVLGFANRRVVGHPLELIAEPPRDLGQVVRVLQIRVREGGEHAVVQRAQRLRVLDLEAVVSLEVDRVDRPGRGDLAHELRCPRRFRVELEAHPRGAGEPPAQRLDRRLLAEPERVDEAHRPRLETEHVVQRAAGLTQREIERGRLERPVAQAQRPAPLRRLRPQLERGEVLAEAPQRPLARQGQRRTALV
jgi:hypothetical protein